MRYLLMHYILCCLLTLDPRFIITGLLLALFMDTVEADLETQEASSCFHWHCKYIPLYVNVCVCVWELQFLASCWAELPSGINKVDQIKSNDR